MRLHHLFAIQTLLELHKQCNIWYARLKHKFILLLNKRLHLKGLRSLTQGASQRRQQFQRSNNQDYATSYDYQRAYNGDCCDSSQSEKVNRQASYFCGQWMADFNGALMHDEEARERGGCNTSKSDSFAIPMHMLLLPFIVHQPARGRIPACGSIDSGLEAPPPDSYNGGGGGGGKQVGRCHDEICRPSPNSLRHLANNDAQTYSFVLNAYNCSGAAALQAQVLASSGQQWSRKPALNCNSIGQKQQQQQQQWTKTAKSTWPSQCSTWANNFLATTRPAPAASGPTTSSLTYRNPLICFPSTSNELGHVKYM